MPDELPSPCAKLLFELSSRGETPTPIADLPTELRDDALGGCERRGLVASVVWFEGSPTRSGPGFVAVGSPAHWITPIRANRPATHVGLTRKGLEWLREQRLAGTTQTPIARFIDVCDAAYQNDLGVFTRSDGTPHAGRASPDAPNWGAVDEARAAAIAFALPIAGFSLKVDELYRATGAYCQAVNGAHTPDELRRLDSDFKRAREALRAYRTVNVPEVAARLAKGQAEIQDAAAAAIASARAHERWREQLLETLDTVMKPARRGKGKRAGLPAHRPQEHSPKADQKLVDDWRASGLTQAQFERNRSLETGAVRLANDRLRSAKRRGS